MAVTPAIDLTAVQRQTVLTLLSRYLPDTTVWAYGSRVKWTSHPASDLDLVAFATPSQSAQLAELREAFDDSNLSFRVDLFAWDDVPEDFRKRIERERVVLMKKDRHVRKEWPIVALGTVAKNLDSRRIPLSKQQRERRRGSYPYYGATGVMDYVDDFLFEGPHVLVAEDGSVERPNGKPFAQFVSDKFWVNNHAHVLTGETEQDTRYLYYAISAAVIRPYISGSVQAKLSQANLNRIPIPFPSTVERQAISSILGAFDAKIELNRRMAEILDETAQALFTSWFVDFDPVRSPKAPKVDQVVGSATLFPRRFTASDLGEVPVGWKVVTLGDLCEKPEYGYTASAQDPSGSPKFLRITDINKAPWIDWPSVPSCKIDGRALAKYRVHKGDLLIARMADPGHGVFVEENRVAVFASYLIRFRLKNRPFGRYLQYWVRSDKYWSLVMERCAGTTRTSLNAKVLSQFPLVVPPAPIANAFAKHVSALRDRVVHNTAEAARLAVLRDSLLPKLVSGEIRISDAEQAMEAVV